MSIQYLKKAEPKKEEDQVRIRELVTEVLERVRKEGEKAVRFYSEKFDKWNPASFRISEEEIAKSEKAIPPELKKSILFLRDQVKAFAEAQKKTLTDFEEETLPGVTLGQKYIPLSSVGAYVPGGRYTLIASAIMSVVPAKVAGVKRIVVCMPAKGGELNPYVIYASHVAGADEIYSIGGSQAIAAMAHGMEGGPEPVDFIAGPGNKFVTEAKRQVFGRVGIDLLAGPTEIGVIADSTADPVLVAADIVGQAEHDPDSPQFLITTSQELVNSVKEEIERQLKELSTAEVARAAWERNGEIILASSREEMVAFSDDYAPEHLEVHADDLDWYFKNLQNYGALFLGGETTVAYGDKAIGTNHILPTGKAARYTGGLWVGKYMKNVTYQRLNEGGSLTIAPVCEQVAGAEGMIGHAKSATVRIKKYSKK